MRKTKPKARVSAADRAAWEQVIACIAALPRVRDKRRCRCDSTTGCGCWVDDWNEAALAARLALSEISESHPGNPCKRN